MSDCSDVGNAVGFFLMVTAAVSFALGWWIKKAIMLEEWRKEVKERDESQL